MDTGIDELTQLFRRGAFDKNLAEFLILSEQLGEPLSLIMADVDKFKLVNDTHGHPYGDEVLQSVARIIKQTVGAKGTCYRYGGEEISILLRNYTADEASSLAERIRIAIGSSPIGNKQLSVTVSFGIAEVPANARTPSELLKAADAALYEAKNFGRNLVRISGEPKPDASSAGRPPRKQPDPNTLSEKEADQIRAHYFTYHHAFCPRDGAQLRIGESPRYSADADACHFVCTLGTFREAGWHHARSLEEPTRPLQYLRLPFLERNGWMSRRACLDEPVRRCRIGAKEMEMQRAIPLFHEPSAGGELLIYFGL